MIQVQIREPRPSSVSIEIDRGLGGALIWLYELVGDGTLLSGCEYGAGCDDAGAEPECGVEGGRSTNPGVCAGAPVVRP